MQKYWFYFLFICFSLFSGGCKKEEPGLNPSPQAYYYPPLQGDTWETLSAASLGWNTAKLEEALEYARQKNSTAVIILYKGKIVEERYWGGWQRNTSAIIASASKSVLALMIGIAQEQGKLDISAPVSRYLGKGWSKAPAAKEDLVTVRHMLTATTGLDAELNYRKDAGSEWLYGGNAYYYLFRVIEKISGKDINTLSQEWLWGKIGMRNSRWWKGNQDSTHMAASGRDMARFGLLALSKGAWDGKAVLKDQQYFAQMTSSSQTANPAYGYLWWINGQQGLRLPSVEQYLIPRSLIPEAPADLIAALGKGDKKIYVVPSKDLVVIRHGGDAGDTLLALSSFDNELWKRLSQAIK